MPIKTRTHRPPIRPRETKQYDRTRGNSHQRGYGARWRKVRDGWLKSHPLCVRCQALGIVKAATDLDHIVPHKGDMVLFWAPGNWQSLCHVCHSFKTATEDGGFGNYRNPDQLDLLSQ